MQKHDSHAGYGGGLWRGFCIGALRVHDDDEQSQYPNPYRWMRILDAFVILGRDLDQIKHFFGSKFPPSLRAFLRSVSNKCLTVG